jgi:hypothetical protein
MSEGWHSAPVTIGGIVTTALEVARALQVLTASAGMMVAQPLRKANSPLAACDYHAAARPWKAASAASDPHHGRGAAGRHITKVAFMACLSAALKAAQRLSRLSGFRDLVAEAIRAFGTDVSFAESICDLARAIRPAIATA